MQKLSSSEVEETGVLQTQLFATAANDWWFRSDAELIGAVANHLSEFLDPINRPSPIQSDVYRYQPQRISQLANEPQLEAISADDCLVDARVPVSLIMSDEEEKGVLQVEASVETEFFVCPAWWHMLSEVAGIHVLQGFQLSGSDAIDIEVIII